MKLTAADLFCGAGGSSTGLASACQSHGRRLDLTAVNHWERAIETHSANHPEARHLCHGLDEVDPRKAIGRKLDLLIASPECTHHSNARGGKPMQDQSRSTAWHVIRWADALQPKFILVENVREFAEWGPLGTNGRPLKRRKGETFLGWVNGLRSLGYTVDWRLLNAADYGDATSRVRLFVMARRGRGAIPWPEPTHERTPERDLFGVRPRWRAAREVIDWALPCPSIFGRKRPLSENTLRRIEAGLRKFGGDAAGPFLVAMNYMSSDGHDRRYTPSPDAPLPTITSQGNRFGLVQPHLLQLTHGGRHYGLNGPLPTVTGANRGEIGLVQPFVLDQHSSHGPRSADDPAPTITTTSRGIGVCQPFVVPTNYGERPGQTPRVHDVADPLPTVVGTTAHGVCQPFLVPYYGTGQADDTSDPVRTLTARDRLGLVQPDGSRLDIGFRMLQPHELAAAMGFPCGYRFAGNKGEVVKQIGNAVAVGMARALCDAILGVM